MLDVVMPLALSLLAYYSAGFYLKVKSNIDGLFAKDTKFSTREVIGFSAIIGVAVTLVALMPKYLFLFLVLFAVSTVLFVFMYIATGRWKTAWIAPLVFILSYLYLWNLILLNLTGILMVLTISAILARLFQWRHLLLFVAILTLLDVTQIFVTGHMVKAVERSVFYALPLMLVLPSFPYPGFITLGLGDFLIANLATTHIRLKYGKEAGVLTAGALGIVFLLFTFIVMTYGVRIFPATIPIVCGILLSLILLELRERK